MNYHVTNLNQLISTAEKNCSVRRKYTSSSHEQKESINKLYNCDGFNEINEELLGHNGRTLSSCVSDSPVSTCCVTIDSRQRPRVRTEWGGHFDSAKPCYFDGNSLTQRMFISRVHYNVFACVICWCKYRVSWYQQKTITYIYGSRHSITPLTLAIHNFISEE